MTPVHLLETALLLGAYVLLAGMYGVTYSIERFKHRQSTHLAATAFYALHCAAAAAAVAWSPLEIGWKVLLLASSAAVFVIPRVTWHFLEHTHIGEIES